MLRKIYKTVINLILVVLLLIGALVIFSTVNPSEKYKLFTVQSGSMEPKIHTGSVIFTRVVERYQVDDIVTRKTKNSKTTITHRIVREADGKFFTKGDANDGEDREEVLPEEIVGKFYLTIPYLGYLVSFSKTSQGFILIIIIPATILIYEELRKIKKEIKKKLDYRKRRKKREVGKLENDDIKKEDTKGEES